jgi:hypothetical protein
MSKKEKAKKDIEMAFDFARYLIDHPEELDKIPDGSEIAFNEKGKLVKPPKAATKKQLRVDVKHAFEIKKKAA